MTELSSYSYKVMPFGMRNVDATYHRLMDRILSPMIARNVQANMDDMVITSGERDQHVADLEELFTPIAKYYLKLNPNKCVFGVEAGKFLGFLLTERGIEANSDKCATTIGMRSPATVKEVQQLTRRMATLSRFLSGAHQRPGVCRVCGRAIFRSHPVGRWRLSVDAFSNQQGNGAGIILEGPNRLFIEKALTFAFKASNNQAEYEALVVGMLLAKELGAQSLLVKSDSLLVTGQVTSEYHAKDPQMASYLRYVTLLRETFPTFKLVHVPREQNARADLLAKLASSDKGGRQRSVIQETLKSPRTITDGAVEVSHVKTLMVSSVKGRMHRSLIQKMLKVPKLSAYRRRGEDSLEVLHVNVAETWMTPYRRYLVDGILPADPAETKAVRRNAGRYTLVNGKLFCHGYAHPILTCVSGDQCTRIMAELNEGICGSHVKVRALSLKVVRAGYYWPTVREDCMRYAQRCEQCHKHADWHHSPPEELRSIHSS
ncbi:uncharacterized protein [Phaseolus vulgaris]|uniref:uncharacterized protein n=1 Tax=Phaseolus vulgaris TaxID=3885 RepID=UPI0035CB3652